MSIIESSTPQSVFTSTDQFTTYRAILQFTGRLCGGAPSDPKLVEGWLAKNLGITDKDELRRWTMKHLAETQGIDPSEATDSQIEAALEANAAEKKAQVFKRDEHGWPYIEPRHVKAMIKEAVAVGFPRGEHKFGQYHGKNGLVGGKEPKSYVAERVFVNDIPVIVAEFVDGVDLAVGHLEDWRGERRSTLTYYEYVDQPEIEVRVSSLDDCLTDDQWARIWTVAEHIGLGARRSQGAGRFVVTAWDLDERTEELA